jgi:EAL domain-containing protein (putative c-di-GMP-specific phosphodiesterase class I)
VPPDKFINIAENSGLIDQLGELILEKACVHAAQWPDIRLAVNISAVQLNYPGFVRQSLEVLQRHGIATNRVEFEITETSLINDTERAKQVFKELQQAGIKVALDDFGTGFSSIGYLRTFQFDRIKIDKSIVEKVLSSAAELAIVQGTLLVARGLSADVTAEGVEDAEQASVLRLAGCSELQGFHYYKPMTAAMVTETLRRNAVAKTPRTAIVA